MSNNDSKIYYGEHQRVIDLKNLQNVQKVQNKVKKKLSFKKLLTFVLVALLGVGIWYGLRANWALEKMSIKEGSVLERIVRLLPIDKSFMAKLPVERSIFEEPNTPEKRINYLILGMRGKGDPNGGLLADSSMVVSVRPYDNKVALISIPRDLYVEMPGLNKSRKLNEAYETGEMLKSGSGLDYAKSVFSNITGIPIHYAVIVNFEAFQDLVDSIGGVEITLDKPFSDPVPLEEGLVSLPAGKQTIDGKTALMYSRVRFSSSDFDRARRQQDVVKGIYSKITKTGLLLNPYRVNKIFGALENNIRTDMKVWETEETIKLFAGLKSPDIKNKVVDTGSEKLLYSTYNSEGAFILLPTGGSYARIKEDIKSIFDPQSASGTNTSSDKVDQEIRTVK